MATDLYEILGVSRDSTQDQIRKAYLKLAHKYHPDKTGGDKEAEKRLKEINAAYDTLKNPEKRKNYDRFGSEGANPFAGAGGGFGGFSTGGGQDSPFDDFFDVLFGQGGGRRGGRPTAQPGNDLELRLRLTLKEAATGAKKVVRFARRENCNDCKGSGAAPGTKPEPCSHCGGAGQVRAAQGFFSVTRTCPHCQGQGTTISKPCSSCRGAGQIKGTREVSIDIPAGVDTGTRLRVSNEGEPGAGGGPRGDLYVYLEVEAHEHFKRDGIHLHLDAPISITQAALGATVRVPTLDGEADLKVPAGTQSGTVLRLRNQGLPDLRGYQTGDLLVHIQVETPTKLSKRQRELLEEFQELSDAKTYPLYRRFLDSLKK